MVICHFLSLFEVGYINFVVLFCLKMSLASLTRFLRLILTFYSTYSFSSILLSIISAGIFWKSGMSFFVVIFWFKLLSMGFIITYIDQYRKNEYLYYRNLGLSKSALWIFSLVFDFILFVSLLIGVYQLR